MQASQIRHTRLEVEILLAGNAMTIYKVRWYSRLWNCEGFTGVYIILIGYFLDSKIFDIDKVTRLKVWEQVKRRKLIVGFHHGVLNPLPILWVYPKMNMIQLINLYLLGSPTERVSALRHLNSKHVKHFDKEGMNLARMKRLMAGVERYGRVRGVWWPANAKDYWNGETVTQLWDGIWGDLRVHLTTVTKHAGKPDSTHKTRSGDLAWRTCHDKLQSAGVFKTLKLWGVYRGLHNINWLLFRLGEIFDITYFYMCASMYVVIPVQILRRN